MSGNILASAAAGTLTPLELVNSLPELIRSGKADSLVEYTADTRIEPIVLIDAGLMGLDCIENALQAQLNAFSAMYLSAVQLGASTINGISIIDRLGRFNPTRDTVNTATDSVASLITAVSTESFKFGLPKIADLNRQVSMEASDKEEMQVVSQTIGRDVVKSLRENTNLSVGKTLEVNLTVDSVTVTVPVIVRFNSIPTPGDVISSELCALAENMRPDSNERRIKLKAGAIRWLADFVACSDLADNHMKTIIKDPSGLYLRSVENARKNRLAGWISGRPSVATASNVYNITEETAVSIERRLGIDLHDPNQRRRVFEKSSMMVLYVFDREFEQVTTYYRGCRDFSRVSFKSLNEKGSNDRTADVLRMMKDFSQVKAPTF